MRKAIVPTFLLFLFLGAITFVLTGPSCNPSTAAQVSAQQSTTR